MIVELVVCCLINARARAPISLQLKPSIADAAERPLRVDADLIAVAMVRRTLVNVYALAAITSQHKATVACAGVAARSVATRMFAASPISNAAFINVFTRLVIRSQHVAFMTGAGETSIALMTRVFTATIGCCTAFNHLHLHSVARLLVVAKLVAGFTCADERAAQVDTALRTLCTTQLTLIDVLTGALVGHKFISIIALTDRSAAIVDTFVITASVVLLTAVNTDASPAVVVESVARLTATLHHATEVRNADLIATTIAVVAAAITTDAGADGHCAGTLTEVSAVNVQTLRLCQAARRLPSILAFVDILAVSSVRGELEARWTAADKRPVSVTTIVFTAAVVHRTLVHIVLTTRSLKSFRTRAQLRVSRNTLAAVEALTRVTQTRCRKILTGNRIRRDKRYDNDDEDS